MFPSKLVDSLAWSWLFLRHDSRRSFMFIRTSRTLWKLESDKVSSSLSSMARLILGSGFWLASNLSRSTSLSVSSTVGVGDDTIALRIFDNVEGTSGLGRLVRNGSRLIKLLSTRLSRAKSSVVLVHASFVVLCRSQFLLFRSVKILVLTSSNSTSGSA